jgi:diaminopimelate decarboxylase
VLGTLDWTGGGALALIEDDDGTVWLDTWRPCFGDAVHGVAQCGTNLPGRLLAACTGADLEERTSPAASFSRLPASIPASHDGDLAPKESADGGASRPPRPPSTQPSLPAPDEDLTDDLRAIIDDLPADWATGETPRALLLPTRTQERFAAFADAADRIEAAFDLDAARIGLSLKTNPADRLLAAAREAGMLAETIHPDEMALARRHGYSTDEIVVNGPVQALLPSLDTAPYALFGDAVTDLADLPFDPAGALIGVRTCPPERGPSRFGVDLSADDRMRRLCERLSALPSAARIGLHLHAPSSTLGHERWWTCVDRVLSWAQTVQARTGRPVVGLDLGGGWHPDDWLDVFVPGLLDRRERIREAVPHLNTLLLEPGKALSQPLGVVVSRVLDARPSRSEVVLDASLAELSNVDYHPHRLLGHTADRGWHRLPRGEGRLLGRLCMEADVLGRRRTVDHLAPGDTVVVCDAGAYDASMTYPFGRGETAV